MNTFTLLATNQSPKRKVSKGNHLHIQYICKPCGLEKRHVKHTGSELDTLESKTEKQLERYRVPF